jgi:hypothetical protein
MLLVAMSSIIQHSLVELLQLHPALLISLSLSVVIVFALWLVQNWTVPWWLAGHRWEPLLVHARQSATLVNLLLPVLSVVPRHPPATCTQALVILTISEDVAWADLVTERGVTSEIVEPYHM